jgi:pantothenate kinase
MGLFIQGGSLAKVVWFTKQQEGGRLNFRKFETAKIEQFVGFLEGLLTERDSQSSITIKGIHNTNFSDRWWIS